MPTLKEHSKTNWTPNPDNGTYPGDMNIIIGCMQRIASATEAMAISHVQLQRDYDYMKESRDNYRRRFENTERSLRTTKGVVTKLNKKIQSLTNNTKQ